MKLMEFSTGEGSHTTNSFWTLKTVYITNTNIKIFYVWYSSSSYLNSHYQQVWQGIPWNIWIPLYLVISASRHCVLVQGVGLIINKNFCELFFNMVQLYRTVKLPSLVVNSISSALSSSSLLKMKRGICYWSKWQ